MRQLVLAMFACCALGAHADDAVLDAREFAERYAALAASTYGVTASVIDELEVRIETDDERSSTSYLDNAYRMYLDDPDTLDSVLGRFVASLDDMFVEPESNALGNLFPVIKDASYLDGVREMMARADGYDPDDTFPLYYESLNEDLVVLYAFDSEASIRFATGDDIAELNVEGRALRIRALDNLLAYLPDIGREGDDSLSLVVADGNYEASLLLHDELWSRDVFRVEGDIVVFVPARDVLIVTGSEDADGLARAREIIDSNDFSYAISPHAYVRTADGWARFEP